MSVTKKLRATACAVAGVLILGATGCAGGGGGGGAAAPQNPDTLTLALASAPLGLDPATGGNADPISIYYKLAYDPLVKLEADGSFSPALATEFGFVGEGNKEYQLKLREGVTFADGSELTAEGVKAWIEYVANANGPNSNRFQNFESVEVTDPLSLHITLKEPNPLVTLWFSQDYMTSDVISPEALKNPESLATETAGAGQYMLDTAQTVADKTYVYTPNPNYWNPDAVQWDSVKIEIMDSTAALNAMRAGQVDYMIGTTRDVDAAEKAGFNVTTEKSDIASISLLDRDGKLAPALADVRVRQALNYAIDRDELAEALWPGHAEPTWQLALPGTEGFNDSLDGAYPYDPEKARELLAEAGYPDGFDMSMVTFDVKPGQSEYAQAVAAAWSEIGVNVDTTVSVSLNDYVTQISSQEFATTPFVFNFTSGYNLANEVLATDGAGSFFNPFGSQNEAFDPLVAEGETLSGDAADGVYQELQQKISDEAWFAPVAVVDKVVISRPGLEGVEMTTANFNPHPLDFSAAG